jgi:hypothetical protein
MAEPLVRLRLSGISKALAHAPDAVLGGCGSSSRDRFDPIDGRQEQGFKSQG